VVQALRDQPVWQELREIQDHRALRVRLVQWELRVYQVWRELPELLVV